MKKSIIMIYVMSIIMAVLFGLIVPAMISSTDSIIVVAGFAIVLIAVPAFGYYAVSQTKKIYATAMENKGDKNEKS